MTKAQLEGRITGLWLADRYAEVESLDRKVIEVHFRVAPTALLEGIGQTVDDDLWGAKVVINRKLPVGHVVLRSREQRQAKNRRFKKTLKGPKRK